MKIKPNFIKKDYIKPEFNENLREYFNNCSISYQDFLKHYFNKVGDKYNGFRHEHAWR